jgi:hypothetical protein
MKNMFTKYLLWVVLAAPLSGAGCVTVSTEYVDSRIDKSIRELEERIKQENSTDVDAVIAKMKGAESAVIKQVVTALTNALDAKKIAMKAQESAEDANVKAVDALDSVTGAVASVAEVKKIADNALEKTSKADARIAEALKAATQAATVAVRSLELTSDTRPVAINAMSYALKTPLISNSAEIANN